MRGITIHRILAWLIRRRILLLAVGAFAAVGAAHLGNQLQLDRSIERMFADDDPILAPYRQLQRDFGEHEIAIAVYSDPQLTTDAGLERVRKLAQQLRAVPGVVAAISLLDPPGAANFDGERRGELVREVFSGYTHNRALNAAGIVCLIARPGSGDPPRGETLRRLRALVDDLPDGALVGEPVLIEEAFDLLEADGRRLNTWCTGLLTLTILACFRELRWLILPLLVVQMTLALTRGTLVAVGLQLSMVSSMLSAIVTVVGVAATVHVIVRYRAARSLGREPEDALIEAARIVGAPILLACLTDAVGFAALMTSSVGPVHDFGLMMAIGSLLVLVSIVVVTPAIVLVGSRRTLAPRAVTDDSVLQTALQQVLRWATRHARLVCVVGTIVTAAGIVGSTRLERETDFTRNFREESRLVRGYQFVEQRFEGAGVWDILLPPTAKLNKKYLARVLRLEQRLLADVPTLTKSISIADALDAGVGGMDQLPFAVDFAIRNGLSLMRARMPEFVAAIYREDSKKKLRILVRSPERLEAAEKTKMIDDVRRAAADAFPGAQVTGYYVLLTQLIESLLRDQWTTFGVAAVAIAAMMAIGFRSFPLAIATLIPNVLPVLALFGAMGWLGIRVNMGAAMIAAVSLGLSVDGSIHYVMSYQRARREGVALADALNSVQATVGRAAVFAALALVIGFATLCFSDFVPTIYFGALVSLSMIGGLVGNLVLLPLLIRLVEP